MSMRFGVAGPIGGAIASLLVGAAACGTGGHAAPSGPPSPSPSDGGASSPGPAAFAPVSAYSYVAKVKNVLVGLPPTDQEVASLVGAPDAQARLRTLIQGWMKTVDPNSAAGATYFEEKMLVFFKLATQQTQVGVTAFADQFNPGAFDVNASTTNLLVQNATESFARTMLTLVVDGGQPLTQLATTTSFMMTTALMEAYAFMDTWQVDDSGSVVDAFAKANPHLMLTVGSAAVPIGESVDPTPSNTNFMHWTDPDIAAGGAYDSVKNQLSACETDPVTYPASGLALHYLLYGAISGHTVSGSRCLQYGGTKAGPQVGNAANGGANDFGDWRMVSVRQPMAGEATTTFYDLPTLRGATTLVLNVPRVGFFTTPAFFANWQTNLSNTMRVTANQSLIVALGAMIDGTDPTKPILDDGGLPPGLDSTHAGSGSACYQCHQLLDPTRSILSSTYSWFYHTQDTSSLVAQKGEFAFQGVTSYPQTVFDFGNILSTHPLFGPAWVQKLCEYANSQRCETTDPEFTRIVQDFQQGGYSWPALVVDLFSSPLTTGATPTQTTTDEGVTVAVSRRDHLCAALNFRLGFADLCALLPTTVAPSTVVAQVAGGLPSDGYGRGAVDPVLPNEPSLFFRAGTENLCAAVAQLVIDVPSNKQVSKVTWSSGDPTTAIADFTQIVAGLVPSDPRYDTIQSLLTQHYQAALAVQGTTATSALRSTFVAACGTPSAISIGL